MKTVLALFAAISAFGQVATPLVVTPGAGTASSEIRLRERRSNGDNYFGWKSPAALASDVMLIGPSDYGSAGQALVTDGSGTTSWSTVSGSSIPVCASTTGNDTYTCTIGGFTSYTANSCVILNADTNNTGAATVNISTVGAQNIYRYGGSALSTNDIIANSPVLICYDGTDYQLPPSASAGSGAWVDGGNSFGADGSLGTNDTFSLYFRTDNANRWKIDTTGNLTTVADGANDIGAVASGRPSNVYITGTYTGASGDFITAGGTVSSNYANARKFNIFDSAGSSGFWDIQAGGSMAATSAIKIRDNAGSRWMEGWRALLGSPLNYTSVFSSLIPAKRAIVDGDAVNDSVFGDLGSSSARWANIYGAALDLTGAANISGNLSAAVINATGSPAYRVSGTTVINASREATFVGLTIPTGASTGYVWTSVDGTGLGYWASPAAVLPVVDTTAIVKGSGDATKLLRFEVDGLTTATTRVLTPQDADYTLAGINIAQTFSATQTFGANILFGTDNTYDVGATGTRARAMYSRIFDTAASAVTGDYVQTRKLNIYDNTGSTTAATFWDLQCVVNGVGVLQESYCYMRDNGGNKVFQAERVRTGSPVDRTLWYTDLLPDTTLGQDLGSAANIWSTIYVSAIGTDLFPTADNAKVLGNGTKRWASIRTVDLRADGFVTFPTGAVNGYIWTSDASGVGSWQAPTSGLPVIDTTGIAKGSLDPTKIVRFEVDGFSTASTRVLTPQNADYTIAGTNIAQTFSAAQTVAANLTVSGGNSLLLDRATRGTNQKMYFTVAGNPSTTGAWSMGTVPSGAASTFSLVHNSSTFMSVDESGVLTWTGSASFSSTVSGSTINATGSPAYRVAGTTIINASREISNIAGVSTDFTPTFSGVYSLGTTSFRWGQVASTNMDVSNIFTISGTVTGNLNPTSSNTYAIGTSLSYWNMIRTESLRTHGGNVSPATSLVGSLGQSTARWSKTWTQDLDITGTITPPSGSAFTGTKTVRDSAGTGTCTMTFSAGIMTGGTC